MVDADGSGRTATPIEGGSIITIGICVLMAVATWSMSCVSFVVVLVKETVIVYFSFAFLGMVI